MAGKAKAKEDLGDASAKWDDRAPSGPPKVTAGDLFRTVTSPTMMRQGMKDETMEPHLHLFLILMIIVVLGVAIAAVSMFTG